MGILFGYYAAADDRDAARAVRRGDDAPAGAGPDELVVKGIDPVASLLTVEALITGRAEEAVLAVPGRGRLVAMAEDGELLTLSLTDDLRDALASRDEAALAELAGAWAAAGDFDVPLEPAEVAELAAFLRRLAALAAGAVGRDHHLYCWVRP
ncbi:hypothetical protein RM844_08140 [Streptomyces sp. DSM 44915]|uniref:Uncharacterized protein n=1 Tax=Streptomyces chisholmiae TaxID=3075540 RepID=A0ABU2JMR2_9ACTN|nr:hypothetical protein [Streptomyces sp. DSM 44915]MDT0266264.1 hypothetical protein [Streptomyces sp. DSM 44915]